ncbi:M23 family metallopeptidase [Nonlabens sp.]|uniref:M23 family metallopeptidase n=1 Tax=Nonlabens sp. TaxID=1888209 RepID=UPI001BCD9345|nr:M23 family metallopeptidase [Nonlabens sp.]
MTTIPYSMFRKTYFYYVSIIVLTIAIISISSCEKDEVFEEAPNELNFPEIKGRFVHGKDLLQTAIIGDKINSLSSNVVSKSNNASGIQIDTSRIQVIESVDYKSYTFRIVQDSMERQSLLRNYMITIVNDTTTIQHLINYEVMSDGTYNMDNIQITTVSGDELVPNFLKCTTSIVEATYCYDVDCGLEGNHPPGQVCNDGVLRSYVTCSSRATMVTEGSCGGAGSTGSTAGTGGSSVVVPVVPVEDEECVLTCGDNETLDANKCECIPENCEYKTGYLHEGAFTNNTAEEGENTISNQDNFRDSNGEIIEETNCDSGKIDSGSEVEVTGPVEVRSYTKLDGTIATSNYYPVEYLDCPKGNRPGNPDYDSVKPCSDCTHGDPVPSPEIQAQLTACGTKGGMYGKTRGVGGGCATQTHGGMDISNTQGNAIYAMFDGVASLKQQGDGTVGAGYYVKLISSVGDDSITTMYFHMVQGTRVSGSVKAGDIIGYQGNSGNLQAGIDEGTTESHVHIKLKKNGATVNPVDYFKTTFN